MESRDIQRFLHQLNNALNSANINSALLRRMHADTIDRETMTRLETALHEAEEIARQFQRQALAQIPPAQVAESLSERITT